VLVHELIHTGMPFVRGRGTWLMEGAATYIEPIIRARAGWKSEDEVWKEWIDNMPRGVAAFAAGLTNASGQQNYWAGATFMLMADIGIRRATDGAKGLEDCLAGALWSGLDAPQTVQVVDYAAACDRAAGVTVMSELVDRYYRGAAPVDLAALWKELGVALVGGRIVLDDSAPSARWRKMIVMGPPSRPTPHVKLPWES
jgi:predicted metalloprotease with PDZ domain